MKHSILLTILLILGACSTSPKNSDKQNALTELDKLKARLPKEVLINAKGYQATTITPETTIPTLTNTEKEHYFINDKYLSHVVTISLNGSGSYPSGTEDPTGTKDKWKNDIIIKAVGYVTLTPATLPGPVYNQDDTKYDTNGFKVYTATSKQEDAWTSSFIGGKDNWQTNVGSVVDKKHYVLINMTDQQLKMMSVDDTATDGKYYTNPKIYKETYNKI